MNIKSTEDTQVILDRLINEAELNIDNPSVKLKKQYDKALTALAVAAFEFDILNSIKQELT